MKLSDTLELGARIRALWPHGDLPDATIKEWHLAILAQPQMGRLDVNEAIDRLAVRLSFPPTLDELVNETTMVWEQHKASEDVSRQIPPPPPDLEYRRRWLALAPRMLLAVEDDPVRHLFTTWKRRTYVPDAPILAGGIIPFSDWRRFDCDALLDEIEAAAGETPDWKRSGRANTPMITFLQRIPAPAEPAP